MTGVTVHDPPGLLLLRSYIGVEREMRSQKKDAAGAVRRPERTAGRYKLSDEVRCIPEIGYWAGFLADFLHQIFADIKITENIGHILILLKRFYEFQYFLGAFFIFYFDRFFRDQLSFCLL